MTRNMANFDRIGRVVIGVGALVAALALQAQIGIFGVIALLAVAAIMLLTSLVSFCPLYRLIGFSTLRKQG